MSKISIKNLFIKRKMEIGFLVLMIFYILVYVILFPSFRHFIYYFSLIFIFLYLFMMFLLIRKDIFKQKQIKEWINLKNYETLPKNMDEEICLMEIRRLYGLLKAYEEELSIQNSDLKDYITRWTHQIKSPIFALNLLLDDDKIDIESCKVELFEIEEYVQNILGYIRLDSDTTDYSFTSVNVDNELRSSIKKYAKQIIHKNNQIKFVETKINILSDPKWFRFIIDQIISNANKYTRNGIIKIYLNNNKLIIEDTGIGIKEDDLPRVFEKGYTGYNGRLDKKATGIGLSLVKDISKFLRIDVSIYSKLNKGTKIIFNLNDIIEEK